MGIEIDKSSYVFGIDLGTTNSSIAVFAQGKSHVIPLDGRKSMPSVLRIKEGGEIIVGQAAKSSIYSYPDDTVSSVKRMLGTGWKKQFSALPEISFSAVDISGEVLSAICAKAQTQEEFDIQGTPHRVVICIPANFTDIQKKETREAAERANLQVIDLIEEPVAAAIAYAVDKEVKQTILVYDLGGGTFDVTIMRVEAERRDDGTTGHLRVLSKVGIQQLGGDDFDMALMKLVVKDVNAKLGFDLLDETAECDLTPKSMREAREKLKAACEQGKIDLTTSPSTEISISNFIVDGSGIVHNIELEVTRQEFEAAIEPLVLKSRAAVDQATKEAALSLEDVNRIIMVGGSTKVPCVSKMLEEMYGKKPFMDADVDTIVARGAAIYGSWKTAASEDTCQGLALHNIASHHLGIEVAGGKVSWIIEKGSEIPADEPLRISRTYTTQEDGQESIRITVYQGVEATTYATDEGTVCIGEFYLSGIPPKPASSERIEVTFELNQHNILTVSGVSSTSSEGLEIKRS